MIKRTGQAGASELGRCEYVPVALDENIPVFPLLLRDAHSDAPAYPALLCHLSLRVLSQKQRKWLLSFYFAFAFGTRRDQ